MIKEGEKTAQIEGLFNVSNTALLRETLVEGGIEVENLGEVDIIVRRELAAGGRNRIFVNNQLATQFFLKKIGAFLVDIHGQGEQATLFNAATHLEMLDRFANLQNERENLTKKFPGPRGNSA